MKDRILPTNIVNFKGSRASKKPIEKRTKLIKKRINVRTNNQEYFFDFCIGAILSFQYLFPL